MVKSTNYRNISVVKCQMFELKCNFAVKTVN